MTGNEVPQRRVWFGRKEHPELSAMPSAASRSGPLPLAPPKRRRTRRWRVMLAALLLLAVLPAAIGLFVLDPGRLTPLASDQLNRILGPGLQAQMTRATVSAAGPGPFSGRVEGLDVRTAEGRPLLSGGDVTFSISPVSLLVGNPVITSVALSGARIVVASSPASSPVFGPDGLLDPGRIAETANAAMAEVAARLGANPGVTLSVTDTTVEFEDGERLLIRDAGLSDAGGDRSRLRAEVSQRGLDFTLSGEIGHGLNAGWRVQTSPIPLRRTFAAANATGDARHCEGSLAISIASPGQGPLAVDATMAAATCEMARLGSYAIALDVKSSLTPGSGVFDILSGRIDVNRSRFSFEGGIAPARLVGAGTGSGYRYELVVNDATLDPVDNAEGALRLSGKLAGTYDPAQARLALDEAVVDTGQGIVTAASSLLFGDASPAFYLALSSPELAVANFKRLWPRFAAPLPRQWVKTKLFGGTARDVRLQLQLPPGQLGSGRPLQKDQLEGGASLSGVRFDTIGDIPPVREADADVRFDGETVDVVVTKGIAYLSSDRSVTINGATLTIADLRKRPVMAKLELDIEGTAAAVAELASPRPVNALKGLDAVPDDFSGEAKAKGTITFPLGATAPNVGGTNSPLPPVDYDIDVELAGLSIAKPVSGQTLSKVDGTVRATPQTLTADLTGDFSGLPARVRFTENRSTGKREQTLTAALDADQRKALLPGLGDIVSGVTPVTIISADGALAVDVDLTKARIRFAAIGWEKGRDVAARAVMRVEREGETLRIRDLQVTGDAMRARGALRIEKGGLAAADLTGVRLSPGDNFSAKLRSEDGRMVIALDGGRIDARAFLRRATPGSREAAPRAGDAAPSFLVTGRIERMSGFNDEVLTDAAIRLDGGTIALSGSFDRGGTLQFSRTSAGLAFSTNNAGAALRFADLYRRMGGGTLEGELSETVRGTFSGNVAIRSFTVSGEPRLAALVNERAEGSASLNEVTQAGIDASRAAFELVQGRLTLRRGGIFIEQGIVRGETMGATVEGVVLDGQGRMDLSGTFMPARGLNRIVGAIPLIGALLGSGTRTGLIGITYRIAGEARNPSVFLNPLSLITPGVFRQIFE